MICSCGHLRAKVGHVLQLVDYVAIQRGSETCTWMQCFREAIKSSQILTTTSMTSRSEWILPSISSIISGTEIVPSNHCSASLARRARTVQTDLGHMLACTPFWQSNPVSQHHRLALQILLLRTMHRMLILSGSQYWSGAYMILKMLIFLFLLLMTHAGTGPMATSSSNDSLSIIGPSVCSIARGSRECATSKELNALRSVLLFSCMAQSDLTSMPASGLLQPDGDHQCKRDYSV